MITKKLSSFHKDKSRLISDKSSFSISYTSQTRYISVLNNSNSVVSKYLYTSDKTSLKALNLMQKVKREVELNEEIINAAPYSENPLKIDYYDFKPSLYDMKMEPGAFYEFSNVWEADITKAYYNAALNLNFISKKTFLDCISLEKSQRLKVLGSLATSKTTFFYKNGKMHGEPVLKQSEIGRKAWFKICSYTDNAMKMAKDVFKENFLFYWVDGIYITNLHNPEFSLEDEQEIRKEFEVLKKHFHFDWEIVKLDKVEFVNTGKQIIINVHKGKDVRPFPMPNRKVVYYGMGTEREFQEIG
jgi:hypothetical protein